MLKPASILECLKDRNSWFKYFFLKEHESLELQYRVLNNEKGYFN